MFRRSTETCAFKEVFKCDRSLMEVLVRIVQITILYPDIFILNDTDFFFTLNLYFSINGPTLCKNQVPGEGFVFASQLKRY